MLGHLELPSYTPAVKAKGAVGSAARLNLLVGLLTLLLFSAGITTTSITFINVQFPDSQVHTYLPDCAMEVFVKVNVLPTTCSLTGFVHVTLPKFATVSFKVCP